MLISLYFYREHIFVMSYVVACMSCYFLRKYILYCNMYISLKVVQHR